MSDRLQGSPQIVVLAAGFSLRLGRPKMLVKIHGISLIRRAVSVLEQATSQPIWVVIPPRAARLRVELRHCRVAFIANPHRAKGLSASVRVAARATRYSCATLFLPADLVELETRDIRRLISRWRGARRRVVARTNASRAAAPLILPKFLYSRALQLTGDIGLRELVAGLPPEQCSLIELPSAVRDIDTVHDLDAARRKAPRQLTA